MKIKALSKKILAITLSFAVLASTLMLQMFSVFADGEEIWDGTVSESLEGAGTSDSPYLIKNGADLAYLAKFVNDGNNTSGKYYKLTKDILLNDVSSNGWYKGTVNDWTPYGFRGDSYSATKYKFKGVLDGDFHVIKGIYVTPPADASGTYNAGLFALAYGASFKNLGIESSYIDCGSGDRRTGAFFGRGNATLEKCYVADSVTIKGKFIGGFYGSADGGGSSFTDCYSSALFEKTGDKVPGAFAGSVWGQTVTLTRCYSTCSDYRLIGDYGGSAYSLTCTDVYTTGPDTGVKSGTVTTVTLDEIVGTNAVTKMTGFDFDTVWETYDGITPWLRGFVYTPPAPVVIPDPEVWDGTVATGYGEFLGSGTKDNPYLIYNGAQLAYVAKLSLSASTYGQTNYYYKLVNDIELNDVSNADWYADTTADGFNDWTPYGFKFEGYSTIGFKGHFDGNYHVIKGIYVTPPEGASGTFNAGLFAFSAAGATFENLGIESSYIDAGSGDRRAAAIVARTLGEATLERCYVANTVTIKGKFIGGLVGSVGGTTTAKNCYSSAKFVSTANKPGAIIGTTWNATINVINCYSTQSDVEIIANNPTAAGVTITCTDSYAGYVNAANTKYTAPNKMVAFNCIGDAAETNMSLFDFSESGPWTTADGITPRLKGFANCNSTEIWNGSVASSFFGGSGTSADPYLITEGSELALLAYQSLNDPGKTDSKYYVITRDIYLNDVSDSDWYNDPDANKWVYGVGDSNTDGFRGTLSGSVDHLGHKIKGLYIDTDKKYAGLFHTINGNASFEAIGIESSYIKSSHEDSYVGAFAGGMHEWSTNGRSVTSCYSDSNVMLEGVNVGGIFGHYKGSVKLSISLTFSAAKITAAEFKGGSIIGGTTGSANLSLNMCYGTQTDLPLVSPTTVTIQKCYNAGTAQGGVTTLTLEQMKGDAALTNMTDLPFPSRWYARENDFPIPSAFVVLGPDTEAPRITGSVTYSPLSKRAATISWNAATDNYSYVKDLIYTVYVSESPITALTEELKHTSCKGSTSAVVKGLSEGVRYYFAVTATDEANNVSATYVKGDSVHKYITYDYWDGTMADGFSYGSGTADDPYEISSAEELAYLMYSTNTIESFTTGKYYTLTVDIYLNDVSDPDWMNKDPKVWTYGSLAFISPWALCGTFDGNGHVVRGLYINKDSANKYNGLFPGVTGDGTIKNLGIEDSYIDGGTKYAAAFVGGRYGWSRNSGALISNCYVGKNVVVKGSYAGGFYGTAHQLTSIVNSYSLVEAEGERGTGTFVGRYEYRAKPISVTGCYNPNAEVEMVTTIGTAKVTYTNCYTAGDSEAGLAGGITPDKMNGENAKQYMPTLDFNKIWAINASGTPTLLSFTSIETWDGKTVSTQLSLLDSTQPNSATNPYLINNAADLAYLAKLVSTTTYESTQGKYYKLTNDIYLNDVISSTWYNSYDVVSWICGSVENGGFAGTLDGDGHIVKGIYINDSNALYGGLFARARGNATIKNLGIESADINISTDIGAAGAIIGDVYSASDKVTVECCYSSDSVEIKAYKEGGLVGSTSSGAKLTFKNSYSAAVLDSSASAKGGILGDSTGASVKADIVLDTCYSAQSNVLPIEGNHQNATYKKSYCCSGSSPDAANVTNLTLADMQGHGAKQKMSNLDFATESNPDGVWYSRSGDTPGLKIFRGSNSLDVVKPTFGNGKIEAAEVTPCSITVQWPSASDNITPTIFMEYAVYYSTEKITEENLSSATYLGSYTAVSEATKTGLTLGDKLYFAVAAIDLEGNESYMFSSKAIETKKSKNGIWSGGVARSFESGSGTATAPYIIANAEQLAFLVANIGITSDKYYYELADDIVLNDVSKSDWKKNNPNEWIYGTSSISKWFYGELDGKGHVVKGIYINESACEFSGLFPGLDNAAVVKNLGVTDSYILSMPTGGGVDTCSGAIAGRRDSQENSDSQVKIIQCFADETVELETSVSSYFQYAGGLIGDVRGDTLIENCYSGTAFKGSKSTGGLVGGVIPLASAKKEEPYLVIKNCYTNSSVNNLVGKCYKIDNISDIVSHENCYTANKTIQGVTAVNINNMESDQADRYMSLLDFENIWQVAGDGSTPFLRVFGNHPEYGLARLPVTITFISESEVVAERTGKLEDKISFPTVSSRDGYEFVGWYVYETLEFPMETFPAFDCIVTAKWKDLSDLRQDFESYPYVIAGESGLGNDYTFYRPGVSGYNASKYVHNGGRSLHRLGETDTYECFQLFYLGNTPLEVGKKYQLKMWIRAEKVGSGEIQLVSSTKLKLPKNGTIVANAVDVKDLSIGEWQEVTVNFVAQAKYLLIRTPGLSDLYFDDITIYDYSGDVAVTKIPVVVTESDDDDYSDEYEDEYYDDYEDGYEYVDVDGDNSEEESTTKTVLKKIKKIKKPSSKSDEGGANIVLIICIIAGSVVLVAAVAVTTVIIVRKKKGAKKGI